MGAAVGAATPQRLTVGLWDSEVTAAAANEYAVIHKPDPSSGNSELLVRYFSLSFLFHLARSTSHERIAEMP